MRAIGIVCLVFLAHASTVYAAAGTVALLGVTGPGGERFSDGLEQELADLYDMIPGDVYRSGAVRLDARGASPEEVSTVCHALRIDAIVAGFVSGDGPDRHLRVVVRAGTSGQVVSRKEYDLSGRTLPVIRAQVARDLMSILDELERVPRNSARVAARPRVVEPEPDEIRPEPDETEATPTEVAPRAPVDRVYRGFFVAVGPGLMTRSLGFDVSSAPGYARGTVVTLQAEGGVFPLALSRELAHEHPVLASFGLLASYEHVFDFVSSTGTGGSASGSASRWSAVLAGRIPLGRTGGTLTIETGFERITWSSKSATTIGVPDVTYALVDGGLGWEHTLGTPVVELGLRLCVEGLVEGGSIMSSAQYGAGSGRGLDASAGLTVRPLSWLWLKLAARYTPLFLTFHDAGARFAHSATDQFADGTLEVGFAL